MRRRDVLGLGLTSLSLAALGRPALAEGRYPEHQIRYIVPRSAGGVVDVVARFWAEAVKPDLGNVIIENQGGGGGIIAAQAVVRAKPDGYTLLCGTTTELVISPATARTHVSRAMLKLAARDRAQLVVFAYVAGLVAPGHSARAD